MVVVALTYPHLHVVLSGMTEAENSEDIQLLLFAGFPWLHMVCAPVLQFKAGLLYMYIIGKQCWKKKVPRMQFDSLRSKLLLLIISNRCYLLNTFSIALLGFQRKYLVITLHTSLSHMSFSSAQCTLSSLLHLANTLSFKTLLIHHLFKEAFL